MTGSTPFAGLHGFVECRIYAGHKQVSTDLISTGSARAETRRPRLMMETAHSFYDTAIS